MSGNMRFSQRWTPWLSVPIGDNVRLQVLGCGELTERDIEFMHQFIDLLKETVLVDEETEQEERP